MSDKVEQLQADIERGVAELVEGDDWRRWLEVAARLPRYSFRNTLLIRLQRPDATAVMGYRAWQARGHQVCKGEQSISILGPCNLQDQGRTTTSTRRTTTSSYLPAKSCGGSVSPTSSTSPKPTETPSSHPLRPPSSKAKPPPGSGTPSQPRSPPPASPSIALPSTAAPTAPPTTPPGRSPSPATSHPAQAAKTLAHELAHCLLHEGTEYALGCRGRAEVEAESVAYSLIWTGGSPLGRRLEGMVARPSCRQSAVGKEAMVRVRKFRGEDATVIEVVDDNGVPVEVIGRFLRQE